MPLVRPAVFRTLLLEYPALEMLGRRMMVKYRDFQACIPEVESQFERSDSGAWFLGQRSASDPMERAVPSRFNGS
jgi:hypothetical protein